MLPGPQPAPGLRLPEATSSGFALPQHISLETKSRLSLCSSEDEAVEAKRGWGLPPLSPFCPLPESSGGQAVVDLGAVGCVSGGGPAGGMPWRHCQIFNIKISHQKTTRAMPGGHSPRSRLPVAASCPAAVSIAAGWPAGPAGTVAPACRAGAEDGRAVAEPGGAPARQ